KVAEKNMARVIFGVVLWGVLATNYAIAQQDGEYADLTQRARAEYASGQLAAAGAAFINLLRSIPQPEVQHRAGTLLQLGTVYMEQDKLSKAEQAYSESLRIYRRLSDKNNVVLVLRHLAALYASQRRGDDALKVLQQALKIAKANSDTNP